MAFWEGAAHSVEYIFSFVLWLFVNLAISISRLGFDGTNS